MAGSIYYSLKQLRSELILTMQKALYPFRDFPMLDFNIEPAEMNYLC
jgi:hypothetical protein